MKKAWLLIVGPFTDKEAAEEVEGKLQELLSSGRAVHTTIAEVDGALETVRQIGTGMIANIRETEFAAKIDRDPESEITPTDLWASDEVTPVSDQFLVGDDIDDTQSGDG